MLESSSGKPPSTRGALGRRSFISEYRGGGARERGGCCRKSNGWSTSWVAAQATSAAPPRRPRRAPPATRRRGPPAMRARSSSLATVGEEAWVAVGVASRLERSVTSTAASSRRQPVGSVDTASVTSRRRVAGSAARQLAVGSGGSTARSSRSATRAACGRRASCRSGCMNRSSRRSTCTWATTRSSSHPTSTSVTRRCAPSSSASSPSSTGAQGRQVPRPTTVALEVEIHRCASTWR